METVQSYRYFVMFIQGQSHLLKVNLTKTKDKVFLCTKTFYTRAHIETGHRGKFFRSDRGGEYTSADFTKWCRNKGIHHKITNVHTPHKITNVHTPQKNVVTKRMNCTLMEMSHLMLQDADLPNSY